MVFEVLHIAWHSLGRFSRCQVSILDLISVLRLLASSRDGLIGNSTCTRYFLSGLSARFIHCWPPSVLSTRNLRVFALYAFAYRRVTSFAVPSSSNAMTYAMPFSASIKAGSICAGLFTLFVAIGSTVIHFCVASSNASTQKMGCAGRCTRLGLLAKDGGGFPRSAVVFVVARD